MRTDFASSTIIFRGQAPRGGGGKLTIEQAVGANERLAGVTA